MKLTDKARAILAMQVSDELVEELLISLVSRATGRAGGRRVGDPAKLIERKIALNELKEGLTRPMQETKNPLQPPDLVFSSPDLVLVPDPDPSKPDLGKGGDHEPAEFRDWYALYPKKRSRGDALKAWKDTTRRRPPFEKLREALGWQRESPDWTRENGKFIPFPATYLRRGNWADEPSDIQADGFSDKERRGIANTQTWLEDGQ